MPAPTELRGKEKWILLRTIARKLVGPENEACGWDETATVAFSQATVEYDHPAVKL